MAQDGQITHRFIQTNGIKMHIAEQGSSGPCVLLLHGFPELWYSWRRQIPVLANAGYHVVAPDLRGYGQTESPVGVDKYTTFHIVGDIIGLLDELNEQQVFVAAHDWGAVIGWDLCLFRPDRVKAFVALSVPFWKPGPSPVTFGKLAYGEDFYMNRFQEPGRVEAEFACHDTKALLKRILLCTKCDAPIAPKGQSIVEFFEEKDMPSWASEEDFDYFAENFNKTGFTGPLNYYRALDLSWSLKAAWKGAKIQVPTLYVTAENDLVYHFVGTKDYIDKGGFKNDVPNLHDCVVLEGAGHFMQQEKHEEVSKLLVEFFSSKL